VEAEEKRVARLKAHEEESAMLAQRQAEAEPKGILESWLGITMPTLESLGLKKPE